MSDKIDLSKLDLSKIDTPECEATVREANPSVEAAVNLVRIPRKHLGYEPMDVTKRVLGMVGDIVKDACGGVSFSQVKYLKGGPGASITEPFNMSQTKEGAASLADLVAAYESLKATDNTKGTARDREDNTLLPPKKREGPKM